MAAYLETKALAVGYHGKPLIEDVALHVQRGRIVTLIGPNGSGKSTILKTIIGQLSKVSGTVFLDGKAMEERSRNEIARRMAILMTARMDPELMTCRDVVSSGRYPYTGRLGILQPEDQAIVERSLAQVGGMEFADRPFSAISDGQRQRILLARALCQEPEIIVLDEPTTSWSWRSAFPTRWCAWRATASTASAPRRRFSPASISQSCTGWSTGSTTPASTAWNLCRKE